MIDRREKPQSLIMEQEEEKFLVDLQKECAWTGLRVLCCGFIVVGREGGK